MPALPRASASNVACAAASMCSAGLRAGRFGDLGLVELLRQVGELVDEDFGPGGSYRSLHRGRVIDVEDCGLRPGALDLPSACGLARGAGDLMARAHEQRQKAAPDCARGAG